MPVLTKWIQAVRLAKRSPELRTNPEFTSAKNTLARVAVLSPFQMSDFTYAYARV